MYCSVPCPCELWHLGDNCRPLPHTVHCIVVPCTALNCTALHYNTLHYTALCFLIQLFAIQTVLRYEPCLVSGRDKTTLLQWFLKESFDSWLDLEYGAVSELVECPVLFQNILRLFYSTMHSFMKFYYAKHTAPYTHRSTGTFLQLAFYPLFLVELVLQFSPSHTAYIHADDSYGCKPSPKCRSFVISLTKVVPL